MNKGSALCLDSVFTHLVVRILLKGIPRLISAFLEGHFILPHTMITVIANTFMPLTM